MAALLIQANRPVGHRNGEYCRFPVGGKLVSGVSDTVSRTKSLDGAVNFGKRGSGKQSLYDQLFVSNPIKMIDKVIIAEDQEIANLSVQKTLEELHIKDYDHAFYCDDALTKIQLAKQNEHPYDLLITDLGFEDDGTDQQISNGYDLIRSVRSVQPGIMILVLTAEGSPAIVDRLFKEYEVDAYVRKARHDGKELKVAFETLSRGQKYYPRIMAQLVKHLNNYEFTEFDITIIRLIVKGHSQREIGDILQRSLSTIEKRLNRIRSGFGFSKNEQLAVFCRDNGLL